MPTGNADLFERIRRQWQTDRRVAPELLTEDVEWVNPPDAVEPGSRGGVEGFNNAIASIFEGWEESRFEPERVVESGDDVVALGELRVRGRSVGVEVRREHGQIWTFRDGRVARMRWFGSHAETLAAAGLPSREQT
ncbi:MAG TPA: nuclear transport factor 2 family protein [Thermoleophilaceae bacterium]|jgi:ketosteroid isomerase-like protein